MDIRAAGPTGGGGAQFRSGQGAAPPIGCPPLDVEQQEGRGLSAVLRPHMAASWASYRRTRMMVVVRRMSFNKGIMTTTVRLPDFAYRCYAATPGNLPRRRVA